MIEHAHAICDRVAEATGGWNMIFWLGLIAFIVGYAVSAFTWEHIHTRIVGVETKVRAFEDKIKALKAKGQPSAPRSLI